MPDTLAPVIGETESAPLSESQGLESEVQGSTADASDSTATPSRTNTADPTTATDGTTKVRGKDRGDGRDDTGKFAPRGSEQQGTDGAQATPPQQDASTQTPAPQTATPDGSPPGPDAGTEEPAIVRYNGVDYPVGRTTKDGTVIPPADWPIVRELIGNGIKYKDKGDAIRRMEFQLKQRETLGEAETKPILAEMEYLYGVSRELRAAQTPETQEAALAKLIQWGTDLVDREPLIRKEVELRKLEAALRLNQQVQAPDPDTVRAEIDAQVFEGVTQHIDRLKTHPQFTALTDADWQVIQKVARDTPQRYAYRTGAQLTPREQAAGAQPNQVVLNLDALEADILVRADLRKELETERLNARKALEAERKNAQRLAQPDAPPPMTSGRAPAAVPAKPPSVAPPSRDEQRRNYLIEMGLVGP